MTLAVEPYVLQAARWPASGRHILAQFDVESVVVYQAYRPEIGHFAAEHGYFGGAFSLNRMSWIKPNFLWMMYRSGWGLKPGQEVVLAVRLRRYAFDLVLAQAVHSTYKSRIYTSHEEWSTLIASSTVRLQWDPDHDPAGASLSRRAVQLGLRGAAIVKYARDWIIDIEDISGFVRQQARFAQSPGSYDKLMTPREEVYPVNDVRTASRLDLSDSKQI